jgi:hypothetical protein
MYRVLLGIDTDLLSHKPFDSLFVNFTLVGGSVSMAEGKLLALLSISNAIHYISSTRHIHAFIISFNDSNKLSA